MHVIPCTHVHNYIAQSVDIVMKYHKDLSISGKLDLLSVMYPIARNNIGGH